ncbi:MAG: hypothetical protein ACQKBW_02300 [Puniceicoccales bacterium]
MAPLEHPSADLARWDRAYRKVALLLRAYQVENAYVRHELARDIVHEALAGAPDALEPEALAVEKLRERVTIWLKRLNDATDENSRNGYSTARMLTIVQAARIIPRWPEAFLSHDDFAPELLQAVREAGIIGVPNLHRTSVGVPQIQFDTVSDVAEGTRRLFQNSLLRMFTFSAIVAAGIVTVIYLAR